MGRLSVLVFFCSVICLTGWPVRVLGSQARISLQVYQLSAQPEMALGQVEGYLKKIGVNFESKAMRAGDNVSRQINFILPKNRLAEYLFLVVNEQRVIQISKTDEGPGDLDFVSIRQVMDYRPHLLRPPLPPEHKGELYLIESQPDHASDFVWSRQGRLPDPLVAKQIESVSTRPLLFVVGSKESLVEGVIKTLEDGPIKMERSSHIFQGPEGKVQAILSQKKVEVEPQAQPPQQEAEVLGPTEAEALREPEAPPEARVLPPMQIQKEAYLGVGGAPDPVREKLVFLGYADLRALWGRGENWQTYGLTVNHLSALSATSDKLIAQSQHYSLDYYGYNSRPMRSGIAYSLLLHRIKISVSDEMLLGVGVRGQWPIPELLDRVISWIPWFDGEKIVEIGAQVYPVSTGAGSVKESYRLSLAGRVYITKSWYLRGTGFYQSAKFTAPKEEIALQFLGGHGGLGLEF